MSRGISIKVFFVASIYNINISGTLNRGINVFEGIRISTNNNRLEKYTDDFFSELVGVLEVEELYKRPYFYFEGQVDISNLNSDEKT